MNETDFEPLTFSDSVTVPYVRHDRRSWLD